MPMHPCKHTLIYGITFAVVVVVISSTIGAQTLFQNAADARQVTQVWKAYALNPHLSANNLEVSVLNGKVTLNGEVESAANKARANVIALRVNGIVAVDNQIVVQTKQTEVDSQVGDGTEQPDRGSWIRDLGQLALLHTGDSAPPISPLDRGAASMPSDKPTNQAKFASALERPQRQLERKSLYQDAFRF